VCSQGRERGLVEARRKDAEVVFELVAVEHHVLRAVEVEGPSIVATSASPPVRSLTFL
jgi:hypothetical protein